MDRIGNGPNRIALTNHALVQVLFEFKQFFHLRARQLAHRDPGPFGDHLGDVVFGDLFPEQLVGFAFTGGQFSFAALELAIQLGQGAVFQLSGLVEVVVALGLLHLQLHLLNLLFEGLQGINGPFLLLPLGIEAALLLGELSELSLNAFQPFQAGTIRFAPQRELLHLQLQDLAIDFIDLLRFGGDLHLQPGRGFIHQVDRFIRQEAIGDVAAA